jgi:hypothetical protein
MLFALSGDSSAGLCAWLSFTAEDGSVMEEVWPR